jgi:autotransporter-associated beta strand protein
MPATSPKAYWLAVRSALGVIALLAASAAARAQTNYFWVPTAGTLGGTGTWVTTNAQWSTTAAGTAQNYTWTNSGNEVANFTGSAVAGPFTVTLGTNITANAIVFNNTNATNSTYNIVPGGFTLSLGGTGSTGSITSTSSAVISAPITSTVGLTKAGAGTLTLSGGTSITGNASVSAGTLTMTAGTNSISGTLTVSGGTANITVNNSITSVAVSGGTATLAGSNNMSGSGTVSVTAGTLNLNGSNLYTGGTTVTGGAGTLPTLTGTAQASGSPFGSTTGPMSLTFATLKLTGIASTTTTTVGDLTINPGSGGAGGVSNLTVNNTTGGSGMVTTFAFGNLIRGGAGSVLTITPTTGNLGLGTGTGEAITFTGGTSLVNGILPPWVVSTATNSSNLTSADFTTYNASGVTTATIGNAYSANTLTTPSSNSNVVNQTTGATLTAPAAAYALRTNQAIVLGGNTLTLGDGSQFSGLILNTGAAITGGTIAFTSTENMVHVLGTASLGVPGDTITSNGTINITAVGAPQVSLGGNIADGASPAKLVITSTAVGAAGSGFVINGNSTYTGGTVLEINNASNANLFIGSDTAFGTGKVTNILVPGTSSPQFQAINGTRTLANAFDLNGGLTFTGTLGFNFNGPLNIINAASGGSRTLNASTALTLTLGASPGSSTITLGNPVANGGDGIGKGLSLTANVAGATITANDVIQDPATGGGTHSGNLTVAGPGTVNLNAQNTYSGGTTLSGAGTIIPVSISSNALPGGAFTSGPFGTGTITFNNGTNQHLRPVGNQRISNAVTMTFGFAMENTTGDMSNLTFAGAIALQGTGRFISNGFAAGTTGGTLIIGDPSQPTTVTLATTASQNLSIAPLAGPIVINDVIQNSGSTVGNVNIDPNAGNNNTVTLNGVSTYTGTTTIGTGINALNTGIIQLGASSNAVGTNGPFGAGTVIMNNTAGFPPNLQPIGLDRTVANAITMTGGFFVSNVTGQTFNLNLNGQISLGTVARVLTNNMAGTLTLGSASFPSSIILGSTAGTQLQFQTTNANATTVVNDVIQNASGGGAGTILVSSGTVSFTNANTYTGGTTVSGGKLLINNSTGSGTGTGAVTVSGTGTGAAAVGTGGTLGGGNNGSTGFISGAITISSTTAGSQGGIIAPGNSIGTLNVGSMTWNPFGQYTFEHSATTGTTGGSFNDFINGTGTLTLSSLGAGNTFTINLSPVNTAQSPAVQTYTLATFAGGLVLPGGQDPNNLNNLFSYTGTFLTAPQAFVNGNSVQLSFTPAVAASSTWTGATSNLWNTAGNWNPAAVPTSGTDTNLVFGSTPNAAMSNDIPGTFGLHSMTFLAGSPVYSLSGNGLNFQTSSGGVLPAIAQNSSNAVSINVPVMLSNNLTVSGSGNLTLGGALGGTGGLTMAGTGTLTLSASNNYSGGTSVQSGTVSVGADANLGTGNVTGGPTGTLAFTATTATTKSFAMGGGSITAAAGTTVTFNGSQVSAAYLDGSGTFATNATNGAQFINVSSTPSVAVISNSPADVFRDYTNSSALTVAPGVNSAGTSTNISFNTFTNQGLGSVTIGAGSQVNAASFQSYGTLTLAPGSGAQPTQMTNEGSAPLGFNTGSRTFISIPAHAGSFDAGIDLHGQNAVVAGGLFVNNGYVIDSVGAGTKTVIADYGALVKGAGFYQNSVQTVNGGKFQSGNSPGTSSFGTFTFGPGGVTNYNWQINDPGPSPMFSNAPGIAGGTSSVTGSPDFGWSLIKAIKVGPSPGNFTWTATAASPLTVILQTLTGQTTVGNDVFGPMQNFDNAHAYSWQFVTWAGNYTGPTDPATLASESIFDQSSGPFANSLPPVGQYQFSWSVKFNSGTSGPGELDLTYTPVPEPGTLALTIFGGVSAGWLVRRRRTKSA